MADGYKDAWTRRLALGQGMYYLITGMWPVLHIESFMWATGPKTDVWLVKTVGLLIVCIAVYFLRAAWFRRINADTFWLAMCCIAAFIAIDVYYAWVTDRIRDIYLADAVTEAVMGALWVLCFSRKR